MGETNPETPRFCALFLQAVFEQSYDFTED